MDKDLKELTVCLCLFYVNSPAHCCAVFSLMASKLRNFCKVKILHLQTAKQSKDIPLKLKLHVLHEQWIVKEVMLCLGVFLVLFVDKRTYSTVFTNCTFL